MADKSSAFSASSLLNDSYDNIKKGYLRPFFADGKKYIPLGIMLLLACVGEAYTFVKLPELFGRLADMFLDVFISSFIKDQPELPLKELLLKNASIGVFMLLNALFSYLVGSFSTRISSGSAELLRNRVFKKLRTVKTEVTDLGSKKSLFEIATSVIDVQNRSLNLFISQVISAVCLIAAVIIKVFTADAVLGITVAVMVPLQLLVFSIINYAEEKHSEVRLNFIPELSELCDNIKELSRSADPALILRRTEENEAQKAKACRRARFTDFVKQLPSPFFIGLFSAAVIVFGSFRINAGVVSIGTVISVIIYLRKLSSPLSQVLSFSACIKQFSWATGEIYSFLDEPDEFDDNGRNPMPPTGGITFKNVSFTYPAGAKAVLENFSVQIPERGITVLSGKTGAGKSTVVKLIMRLYAPGSGSICIGDTELSEIELTSYRSAFSVIPQDAQLFDGTVEYNIIYPETEKDELRLRKACQQAGLDFADSLPQGIGTVVGGQSELLTVGQRQQILIARAFYHQARFLIFDEAFSHTDAQAEAMILRSLRDCALNCGIIFISHNNSDAHIPGARMLRIKN